MDYFPLAYLRHTTGIAHPKPILHIIPSLMLKPYAQIKVLQINLYCEYPFNNPIKSTPMKAKTNELFEDFTGSTGNITAAHSAGHLVVRNKVTPTYTDTDYQHVVRQNFTRFAKNWQDLTDAQRALWAEKAKVVSASSSYYGISGKISGFNLYVRCNMNLELIGITTPLTTPVDNMTGLLPDFKAVNLSGSELKIALEGNVEENDVLVVQITPLSVGQSTNINGLRQVGTVAGGASETIITEKYTAQFGTPAVGDKVQVQIYAINTLSGYASTRQTTVTNIAEESAGS